MAVHSTADPAEASISPDVGSATLLERYMCIRRTSMELAQPFSAEDQMLQSMPDASPVKWHLAHTTWFFETFILAPYASSYQSFDSRFKHLFNSYYKQLGSHPNRGTRGLMSRPSLSEVHGFRAWVDRAMEKFLEQPAAASIPLIEVGLNHEQQHQELILTDIKHALWSMPLRPDRADGRRRERGTVGPLHWQKIEGGIHSVGHDGTGFYFDNEAPRHEVLLRPFQIASRQITNAEFLEFMHDSGYRRPELWLSDGWDAVNSQGWVAPMYWEKQGEDWMHFTYAGLEELDLSAPVCHVSYFEADAFARWSGARLPREEEWEVAATQAKSAAHGVFLEDKFFHPQPARGEDSQWLGNVWEWTSSPYVAYPGFTPAPGLVGEYNGKFMCNQFVLRGGSCATPRSHIRLTYRNFFPAHTRWQFMGIRLAK